VEHQKQEPKAKLTPAFIAQSNRGGPVHFLIRGEVERKREQAQPGFVQVLTKAGENDERWLRAIGEDRSSTPVEPPVALAHWLTDTECGAGNRNTERLWHARRSSDTSRTARLARCRTDSRRLEA
jgi:hypothetical protein